MVPQNMEGFYGWENPTGFMDDDWGYYQTYSTCVFFSTSPGKSVGITLVAVDASGGSRQKPRPLGPAAGRGGWRPGSWVDLEGFSLAKASESQKETHGCVVGYDIWLVVWNIFYFPIYWE